VKRILVVLAHGGIGDLILATPVFKSLKEELSADFIAVLVSSYGKDILVDNPYIDEIIIDADPFDRTKRAHFFYLLKKIKKHNFDCAIILWSTARFAWLVYLSGIPVRVGQDFRFLYSFLYTNRVKIRTELGDITSHWVDCLMDFPLSIGCKNTEPELSLPIKDEYKKEIAGILKDYNVFEHDKLVGFHTGRGINISEVNWPYKNFALIADELQLQLGVKVVLTGGHNEKEIVDRIEEHMKTSPVNLAGKCSIMELAALIDRCNVFISPDSGPMHMAAACKTPTVAIFALKSDLPARWKPYKNRHIIVRKDVSCNDRCIKETCKTFTCMHEISVNDIVEPVKKLLSEK
jgi:lipopolysaccharide heptosyltransferase II